MTPQPTIHVYESATAPADIRFMAAQRREKHLFCFQYGSSAEDATTRLTNALNKIGAKSTPKVKGKPAAVDEEDPFADESDDLDGLLG